jgi:hypothetical protein
MGGGNPTSFHPRGAQRLEHKHTAGGPTVGMCASKFHWPLCRRRIELARVFTFTIPSSTAYDPLSGWPLISTVICCQTVRRRFVMGSQPNTSR